MPLLPGFEKLNAARRKTHLSPKRPISAQRGVPGMRRRVLMRMVMPYWRLSRGMTLGVRGVILREGREVLLIRHGYQPGWHFPGGGVEWRETLLAALAREVEEESGVIVKGTPALHGLFANFHVSPSDHVAVFIIRDWEQHRVPAPTFEIQEQRFFALSALPPDISRGTRRRVCEIFEGQPVGQHW
jgi:ADP-ribose pyrophosphatase YjhB (NUDIX family)